MAFKQKLVIFLVFCLAGQSLQLPAPQLSNSIPDSSLPDDQGEAAEKDEDYYYYADYDPSDDSGPPALPDLTGLLGAVGSVLPGLLQLVQAKVAFINNILSNKEFQERIGETIEVGGNLVHRIVIPVASRVVPVAIDLVGKVPELISAGQNILTMGAQAVGTLNRTPEFKPESRTAGGELMAGPARLLGSIVKATNETAPLVEQSLSDLDASLPTLAQIATAYVQVNAQDAQKTAETFHRTFNCDFECGGLTGSTRTRCEQKHCKNNKTKSAEQTAQEQRTPRRANYNTYYRY